MSPFTRGSILVVDDDRLVRNLLYAVLSESGFDVDTAENGRAGLERIMDKHYDLIVTDVNMPVMNGPDFYKAASEFVPESEKRFLFLTSSQSTDTMEFCSENRCQFMSKPFKTGELLYKIEGMLTSLWREREERYDWSVYCQLSTDGLTEPSSVMLIAKTVDVSEHGAKIRYFGKPLQPGKTAYIYLKELNLKRDVKIIWSKSYNESVLSGILSPEAIPTIFAEKGTTPKHQIVS